MYQTIIVPVDGSAPSEAAIPVAARLARGAGATLELVRVHRTTRADLDQNPVWGEVFRDLERKRLASLAERYEPMVGRPIVTELLEPPVVTALWEHTSSRPAPLIVMTVRGRTGLRRAMLGSVSDGLVRQGVAPVLALRQRRRDGRQPTWKRADGPFHTVVVPLDGTALAEVALGHAIALARLTGARLHLVRVVEPAVATPMVGALAPLAFPMPDEATLTRDDLASEYLEGVAARINADGGQLAITTEIVLSDRPATTIVDSGRRNAADLMVMATHGRGGSRLLLGSVADSVLRKGPDAILFVHPTEVSLPAGLAERESSSIERRSYALANDS